MTITHISDIHADAVAALAADPAVAAVLGLPAGASPARAARWIERAHRDWRAGRSRTYACIEGGSIAGIAIMGPDGSISRAAPAAMHERLARPPAGCAFGAAR
jgi:hypothetical protein